MGVNSENENGDTALDFSVRSISTLGITKYFLENGANINHVGYNNYTPLLQSIEENAKDSNLETVKYLIEKGADINSKTKNNWNALHLAARYGHPKIVKLLLDKGLNINEKNIYEWTPINLASFGNHLDVVKLLLENGASLEIKNDDGETPLDTAIKEGHVQIVNYFKNLEREKRLEEQRIAKEKKENELKNYISKLIVDGDFEVLKEYTDKNPNAVYYIRNKSLRLALTGPKGMKVGDVRKLIKEGNSEVLIISLIKRVESPYKVFTLDEIKTLQGMDLSDNVIAAMIDVTTQLLRDEKLKKQQEELIAKQERLAKQQSN